MFKRIKRLFKRKVKTQFNIVVHLNDGTELESAMSVDHLYTASEFRAETIWRFSSRNGKHCYMVGGDRISYIDASL